MSQSKRKPTSNAFDKPGRTDAVLSLATSLSMLPLVERIVRDVLRVRQELEEIGPEFERLTRRRAALSWPDRRRRYLLQEKIAAAEHNGQQARNELESLGVALTDPVKGQVGFPTIVNGRRAYFSWSPGEDGLHFWQFVGETARRSIPAAWKKELGSQPA